MRGRILKYIGKSRKVQFSRSKSTDPGADYKDYRPLLIWGMNGPMTPESTRRQMELFCECGYGGVMVLPWGGLPYQFMSDEWLDAVECIILNAESRGMEVWIWDDWIFPSGFAGGSVGQEEKLRSKRLKVLLDVVLEDGERYSIPAPPKSIAAGAFEIDKLDNPCGKYTPVRVGDDISYTAAGRERLVVVGWEYVGGTRATIKSHSRFLTDHSADIYKSGDTDVWSTDLLSRKTTESYISFIHEVYRKRFSAHFGKTIKGFFYDEPNVPSITPWTWDFPAEFKKRKGYDIRDWLVRMMVTYTVYNITATSTEESVQKARSDYNDVWTTLYAENFHGVLLEWCTKHGVLCAGHQGSDETLSGMLSGCGTFFKNMLFNHIPGVDVIWDQVKVGEFTDFPRMAGSSRSLQGKPLALSESFAAMGHGIHLDTMRFVIDHQMVRGVNKFMHKIANYDAEKSFYFHPPDVSPVKNPFVRLYGSILNRRTERLCSLFAEGGPVGKACIFVPLENYYRGDKGVTEGLDALARQLTYNQLEYDYIWYHDLADLRVEDGQIVSASGACYTELIIAPSSRLKPEQVEKICQLKRAGAGVIACAPQEWDTSSVRLAKDVRAACKCVSKPPVPGFLSKDVPVSTLTRRLPGGDYITLLLNESLEEACIKIACPDGWAVCDEDPISGRLYRLLAKDGVVCLSLSAGESRLVRQGDAGGLNALPAPVADKAESISLNSWTLKLPDGHAVPVEGAMPSWAEIGFGDYTGTMEYTAAFKWESCSPHAILDLGRVCYAATVLIDGKHACDVVFTPFKAELHNLSRGEHTITVRVLNTFANSVCGTEERYRELKESGVLNGTYAPIYVPIDRKVLDSGLLGPVTIMPART
jgi:hypothetical protein